MIKTAQDMIRALKRGTYCGVILYQGPSLIDNAPIVVIANRIVSDSDNAKTGAMVQTFILRTDMRPLDAARRRHARRASHAAMLFAFGLAAETSGVCRMMATIVCRRLSALDKPA